MKLSRQILSYSLANIINSAVPFFLLPILTVYLSPKDYGLLSLVQLLMALSLPFVLLNIHGLFVIEYSKLSQDEFADFISTIQWIPLLGFLFLEAIFWIFQAPLASVFKLPKEWILWMPLFALMQAIPTMIPVLFQAQKNPVNYGLYKILMTLANMGLSILFVVSLKEGWEGRLWGIFGSYALFSVIGLVLLKKMNLLKTTFSARYATDSLRFGIPLIPHVLSGTLLAMSDRLFLANMLSPKEVGIYSVSYQLASSIAIIVSSFNQAWVPHLFEKLNQHPSHASKLQIVRQTYKIVLLMVGATLLFIGSVHFLYVIFIGSSYHSGKIPSVLIAIAFLFQGLYFMVTNYIFYTKKTHILSIVTVSALCITLILNSVLVPKYGLYGSAISMVIVSGFFFISTWILSYKVYPMPWTLSKEKDLSLPQLKP